MPAIVRGSARIDIGGTVTQLGARPAPDEVVTEADVQEPAKLARLLTRILRELAGLRRQWVPRTIDYEIAVLGAGTVTIQHNFGGRVRWWVVGWVAGSGTPLLREQPSTTADTLTLSTGTAGTIVLRVQEAG